MKLVWTLAFSHHETGVTSNLLYLFLPQTSNHEIAVLLCSAGAGIRLSNGPLTLSWHFLIHNWPIFLPVFSVTYQPARSICMQQMLTDSTMTHGAPSCAEDFIQNCQTCWLKLSRPFSRGLVSSLHIILMMWKYSDVLVFHDPADSCCVQLSVNITQMLRI